MLYLAIENIKYIVKLVFTTKIVNNMRNNKLMLCVIVFIISFLLLLIVVRSESKRQKREAIRNLISEAELSIKQVNNSKITK